jgi:MFS family permease
MTLVFQADDLQVTDDWIRSSHGTFPISGVRKAWVTRRQSSRGSRMATAGLGIAALLVAIGGAGLAGLLSKIWIWLLAAPVLFLVAAWLGILDPIAIYLEKRRHELWIATDSVAVCLWKANKVEVHKALRAIQRARERHREQSAP